MAGNSDGSVVGSPRNPCSSFFMFPEYLLYSHSVDFLLLFLLLLHMVECSLLLQESSWVDSLGPNSKFSREGDHCSNLDNVPTFGWGWGVAHCTLMAAAHEPCEWGWEGQHPQERCWVDNPSHVYLWLFSSSKGKDLSSFSIQQVQIIPEYCMIANLS